jgi:hypothetical protein
MSLQKRWTEKTAQTMSGEMHIDPWAWHRRSNNPEMKKGGKEAMAALQLLNEPTGVLNAVKLKEGWCNHG